jgi:hypothetical protein
LILLISRQLSYYEFHSRSHNHKLILSLTFTVYWEKSQDNKRTYILNHQSQSIQASQDDLLLTRLEILDLLQWVLGVGLAVDLDHVSLMDFLEVGEDFSVGEDSGLGFEDLWWLSVSFDAGEWLSVAGGIS